MNKKILGLTLGLLLSVPVAASAVTQFFVDSAADCNHTGLTASNGSRLVNLSGSNKSAFCPIEQNLGFAVLDEVEINVTNGTPSTGCFLRDGSNNSFGVNTTTNSGGTFVHNFTTDRPGNAAGYAVDCVVPNGQTVFWTARRYN